MRDAGALRVLIVNLARGYGGPETRALSQARALQGSVERCAVAVARDSPLHQRLAAEGIPCEPITAGRSNPAVLVQLARVIRRGRYNVVDAQNIQSIFWGHLAAVLGRARGRVTTVHSDYGQEYTGIRRLGYRVIDGMMRPITRHFVNVTEHLQERAGRRAGRPRSTLIPNAVTVAAHPGAAKEPALLQEWGWAPSDFVVAVVGRLFAVKGQAHLIDALSKLDDLHQVKLLVVGDGPLRLELERHAARVGVAERVRFLGFRPDITRILQSVDCVCLPSLWELLPYAALEAAAQGRPIVATEVGGVPRLLSHGDTALLVPPADPAALAAAIRSLARDPAEARRLGEAAYTMVRDAYGEEEMLRRTLDVYRNAVT